MNEVYIGDPVNAVKIFNEKEVDEIVILDIGAGSGNRPPDMKLIGEIASECFMPMGYGGGITRADEAAALFATGIEKISLNTSALNHPGLITEIASRFGSQSIVVSLDVKKDMLGRYRVYANSGKNNTGRDPVVLAKEMQDRGAGEILLTSIDREGSGRGYDLDILTKVASSVSVPVVVNGGAAGVDHFAEAVRAGASAVAAGSMFVFQGKLRGVLINFPSQDVLKEKLYSLPK